MGIDLEGRERYLRMERVVRELAKDVSVLLETYDFTPVEWKEEGDTIKLIAEKGRSRMELKFEIKA